MVFSIYKATNIITGKSYIGFDSNWPKRKFCHKSSSKHENTIFYCAIRKYGWDNFKWDVIYQSTDSNHCLKEMEPYFIKEYDTFNRANGYNMTLGGDGTFGFRMCGKENPFFGKKHSEEMKRKMSETKKGKPSSNKGKKYPILSQKKSKTWMVTTPSGEQLIITNLFLWCKEQNLSPSAMSMVASGKRKHHKGYTGLQISSE